MVTRIIAVWCGWLLVAMLAGAEVRVQDDRGESLVLSQPAQRVVVLAPHLVELMYSIGAGDRVVGTVSFSNYPQAARSISRVGTYQAFSLESIVQLQPDLVIGWMSGNGMQRLTPIAALGIPVFMTDAKTLDDVSRLMRLMGDLTAAPGAAAAANQFDETLADLRQRYAQSERVTVFYQVWNDPLRTISNDHLIGDVIQLCGGVNVFGDAPSLAPVIGLESVLLKDPQVIVASGMAEEQPQWLDDWKRWTSLQAVRNRQLKFVPPDLLQRHTARILDGARLMCEHLDAARATYNHEGGT